MQQYMQFTLSYCVEDGSEKEHDIEAIDQQYAIKAARQHLQGGEGLIHAITLTDVFGNVIEPTEGWY